MLDDRFQMQVLAAPVQDTQRPADMLTDGRRQVPVGLMGCNEHDRPAFTLQRFSAGVVDELDPGLGAVPAELRQERIFGEASSEVMPHGRGRALTPGYVAIGKGNLEIAQHLSMAPGARPDQPEHMATER